MQNFKKLDLFGNSFTLTYKNKVYKTYFGSFYTLLIIIFGVIAFIYFGKNFFYKINPTIIQSHSYLNKKLDLRIKQNNFFFTFAVFSSYAKKEFINETIFQMKGYYLIINRSKNKSTKKIFFRMEKCNKTHIPKTKEAQEYFKFKKIENFYCINSEDFENMKVIGNYDDDLHQSIYIHVIRCEQSTKEIQCAGKEEIDKYFETSWLQSFYLSPEIKVENFMNPILITGKIVDKLFMNGEYKEINFNLQHLEIISDSGFIFKNELKKKLGKLENVNDETHLRKTNVTASFRIEFSKKKVTIKRFYDKLPKVFAELGGILNIFFLIGNIFIKHLTKLFFLYEIINDWLYIKTKDYNLVSEISLKKEINKKKKQSNLKIEGKINQINQNDIPLKMKENYKPNMFFKFHVSFLKFLKIFFFGKKKNKIKKDENQIIYLSIKKMMKNLDLTSIIKKVNEIDLIKTLIFDENQLNLFEKVPKIYLDFPNSYSQNKKTEFSFAYDKILNKDNKNKIDLKLLNLILKKNN